MEVLYLFQGQTNELASRQPTGKSIKLNSRNTHRTYRYVRAIRIYDTRFRCLVPIYVILECSGTYI